MNSVQEKLLEIFIEFDNVCKKLGITYFAYGGTCLGAIRHQGFIPWDDDMDFCLTRKDFNTLVTKGNSVIKKPFFIQFQNTDKNWMFPFAKVRNSETTAYEKDIEQLDINHGLWIDIMPLDITKNTKVSNFIFNKTLRLSVCRVRPYLHTFSDFIKKSIAFMFYPTKKIAFNSFLKYSTKFNNSDYNYLRTWYVVFPKQYFDEAKYVKFENAQIKVSKDSAKLLEIQYGDWKKLPPIPNRNSGAHMVNFLDLNKSYKCYEKRFIKK